jgi:23S rRNA (uridine2552-2'-O)-methyltransferase
VGPTGKVVGVDRVPVPPLPDFPQVQVLEADIESPEVQTRVAQILGGAANVVLCDVSPKLTGVRERDWARARELAERAIELAAVWLRPGGTLLLKVFMSPNWKEIVDRLRSRFENVSSTRPEATRKGSSELYVIARGLRPDTASDS